MQKQQNLTPSRKRSLVLLFIFILVYGGFSLHVGQDINWDLLNYHFYNPYAFLHHRMDLDIAPAMLQTFFSPTMDLLNYFLITTLPSMGVGFVLGALSGISAFVLYQCALILFSDARAGFKQFYALIAVIIGTTGWAGMTQLGATTNETKTALLVIIAFYLILRSISHPAPQKNIAWAGFIMGITVGLKLTAALYALGIVMGILCGLGINRQQLYLSILFSFMCIIGFFVSDGYWLWIMYQHYQNPLFPFYNNLFHSPYLPFLNYEDHHFRPTSWEHYLFLPFFLLKKNVLTNEVPMRDPRLAITYALSVLFILKKICCAAPEDKLPPAARFMLITFFVSYVAWLLQFAIYRYVVPLEFFAGLTIVYFLQRLIKPKFLLILVLLVLTVLSIRFTEYYPWGGRIKFGEPYFNVHTEELPNHSIVLFSNQPMAFAVPFFYSATPIRFIGFDNNLVFPTNHTNLQNIVNQLINTYHGPIFTLTYQQVNDRAEDDLHYYNMTQIKSQCRKIETTLDPSHQMILCPVKRK